MSNRCWEALSRQVGRRTTTVVMLGSLHRRNQLCCSTTLRSALNCTATSSAFCCLFAAANMTPPLRNPLYDYPPQEDISLGICVPEDTRGCQHSKWGNDGLTRCFAPQSFTCRQMLWCRTCQSTNGCSLKSILSKPYERPTSPSKHPRTPAHKLTRAHMHTHTHTHTHTLARSHKNTIGIYCEHLAASTGLFFSVSVVPLGGV